MARLKTHKTEQAAGVLADNPRGALLAANPGECEESCWQNPARDSFSRSKRSKEIVSNMLKYADKVTRVVLTIKPRTLKALNLY